MSTGSRPRQNSQPAESLAAGLIPEVLAPLDRLTRVLVVSAPPRWKSRQGGKFPPCLSETFRCGISVLSFAARPANISSAIGKLCADYLDDWDFFLRPVPSPSCQTTWWDYSPRRTIWLDSNDSKDLSFRSTHNLTRFRKGFTAWRYTD